METAADHIETLRFDWERDLESIFAGRPLGTGTAPDDPGLFEPRVLLEATMAKRVHRLAREAAERVGFSESFVLYQTPSARPHLTAQALLAARPFAIRLVGPVAKVLDDAALVALIGHELGHALAHGLFTKPPSSILESWERGAGRAVAGAASVAAEITADRFSLIAAGGELEAAIRLDVGCATLDSPAALGLDELTHFEVLRVRVERGDDPLIRGGAMTSAFRLYATWLFWRSDWHKRLTGVGAGDLPLREVDATLRAMCVSRVEPFPAMPPLAPDAKPVVAPDCSDDVDDLEKRFRELEAACPPAVTTTAPVPDDLEARFRALEEADRRK